MKIFAFGKRRASIGFKVIVTTSSMLALVMVVAMAIFLRTVFQDRVTQLEEDGVALAEIQAMAVAQPLWNMQNRSVIALLDALSVKPAVQAAEVVDQNKTVIHRYKNEKFKEGGGVFTARRDIIYNDDGNKQKLGEVKITLSKDGIWSRFFSDLIYFLGGMVVLLSVLIGATAVALKQVTGPLLAITMAMSRLSDGHLEVEVPGVGRRDEIGDMANAVQVFKDNALEVMRLRDEQEALEQTARDKKSIVEQLVTRFDATVKAVVQSLMSAAKQLKVDAQSLASTADRTNGESVAAASAAQQASLNVHAMASAAEQLSSSVTAIDDRVAEASKIGSVAVEEARRTNDTIGSLAEAASKIGEVVALINNIASQTNLLALNATIEAARAGDAGKGFAVVAGEVKNLANQTAKATEDIQAQVAQMQGATHAAVDAIKGITSTVARMSEITVMIAAAVQEQDTITRQIARNANEAASGTMAVSKNISEVTGAAFETGRKAGGVLTSAGGLEDQAEALDREMIRFIGEVRVA